MSQCRDNPRRGHQAHPRTEKTRSRLQPRHRVWRGGSEVWSYQSSHIRLTIRSLQGSCCLSQAVLMRYPQMRQTRIHQYWSQDRGTGGLMLPSQILSYRGTLRGRDRVCSHRSQVYRRGSRRRYRILWSSRVQKPYQGIQKNHSLYLRWYIPR